MKFFRWWFNRESKPTPEIAVGSTWLHHATDDPFPARTDRHPVIILGVKDGWVRYKIGDAFPDERMKLDTFLYCYKPTEV